MTVQVIHVSRTPVYQFEGWLFEYGKYLYQTPWPLRKDFEPRKRAGRKFYDMLGRFLELSEEERGRYRV